MAHMADPIVVYQRSNSPFVVHMAQKASRVGTELLFSTQLEPDGLLVWVLASALGLSLVFSLVSVPLQCFHLSKAYGLCLLLFYFCFLVVVLLTEFGVIHLKKV